jgi:zinc/manganese transport system substrate-binding protein
LALAILATACGAGPRPTAKGGRIEVVVGENFWGDIASQLGGTHVQVRSIITNPNTDPHLYESTASDALAVARAQVVIENGAGYDDFMSRILGAVGSGGRIVVSVQRVLEVGRSVNPHFWYDIDRVPRVVAAIDSALVQVDPADKADYQANLARFDASLVPLQAAITEIKRRYPGAPVAYTERVPGYLLADAGLTVSSPPGFAQAVEDGNDPSVADIDAMYAQISGRRVRVLLYNTQTVSAVTQHVKALAAAAGVPVVGVSETLPRAEPSYQAWQLSQIQSLAAALGHG